ncbi:ATPase, T2SS/T4P/T4SS family [Cupriavidus sp. UYPR2.512]|uniref:ATPase, T2SS/T4P/T4SS family n=1 Tax=Cupriavidus sp. UYPR2.512 TaxID=1080187 RepID=UPI0009DB6300|nr:ATPase, T2SS/T4P/T4SS family [Cupriavidus sp. UYPR2.512]UIF89266.1 Flp pilus assembly complex ATPase component TadA [Cupriavidus necator]
MPSIICSAETVHEIKRASRAKFPQIKNAHLLEAIARGFGFETWAAFNTVLKNASEQAPLSATFTSDLAQGRLVELGYPELASHSPIFTVIPTEARGDSLQRRGRAIPTLQDLAERGMFTADEHQAIRRLAEGQHTILVAGPTGSGKSTLMHAILDVQAHRRPRRRIGLPVPGGS